MATTYNQASFMPAREDLHLRLKESTLTLSPGLYLPSLSQALYFVYREDHNH